MPGTDPVSTLGSGSGQNSTLAPSYTHAIQAILTFYCIPRLIVIFPRTAEEK